MLKYIEVNANKKPKYTFDKAKTSYEDMNNAALLVPEGVVIVDFDGDNIDKKGRVWDEDIIFYLLKKYKPYWTKSRPQHFQLYFKLPKDLNLKMGADILTLGGFQVDYRTGKNSVAIIKTDGSLRESACKLTEEVLAKLPILPTICYPMYKNNDHTTFVGMEEGDGRDDILYHHTIFARKRYKNLDLKDAMYYINHHLFKEPLEDKIIDSQIQRAPIYADKSKDEIENLSYEFRETKLIKFSDVKTEEPKWIWYPYIPLGTLVLLVGDPGVGKSYIALYIASIVSNGDEFPFDDEGINEIKKPSKVLFQNGEDGVSYTLSLRLDKLGANKENIFMIDETVDIFRIDQIDILEDIIINNGIKLIIIDPIQRYLPNNKSMDKANEVRNSLSPLRDLAEKHECTIIIIMHRNKSNASNSLYRALGSIDFVGVCRSMLTVEKNVNNGKNFIHHTKSSLSQQGQSILYEINEDGLEIIDLVSPDEDSAVSKVELAKEFLKNELKEGPLTNVDIKFRALSQNISISTLKRAKKKSNIYAVQFDKTWFWSLEKDIDVIEAKKRYS